MSGVDALATGSNVFVSLALVFFARQQWRVMREGEDNRERERRSDLDQRERDRIRAADISYGILYAEWFRIWTVATTWERSELIEMAKHGQLDPTQIRPRDWASLTSAFSELGIIPARLGSYALARCNDAEREAKLLCKTVETLQQGTSQLHASRVASEAEVLNTLAGLKQLVIAAALEAANLIEDALEHSECAKRTHDLEWNDELHSNTARAIKDGLIAANSKKSEGLGNGPT